MNKFNVRIGDIVLSNTVKLKVIGFCDYSKKHVYAEDDQGHVALVLKSRLQLLSRNLCQK